MWWYRVDVVPILPMCPVRGYVLPNFPTCPVPVSMLFRYRYQLRYRRPYRYRRYRYPCRTELTKGSDTGIDVVPNLPKCPVPILMSYRTYRSVRYRYSCCTELTEVSSTGIDVAPNLPKCPVSVLMYRTYQSVGTSNTGGIYRRYDSVRTVLNAAFFACYPLDYQMKKKC